MTRTRGKGVTEQQRPLWLLTPGGLLMTVIIIIPLLLACYIALIDLDQYTLRRWLDAPFVGLDNFVEAFRSSLPHSMWISVSFAVISTIATVPFGVAAAIATQNKFRGRGLVRAIFLIPYVLPSFVVATVWRTMLQPDGIVNTLLSKAGVDGGLWLSGPKSYWTLILVEIWA
ncbi:MAG: sugar ABC transporter permease, partial [Actinoplanes sp.]